MNEESWMRGQQTCPLTIHFNMWTVSLDVSIQRRHCSRSQSICELTVPTQPMMWMMWWVNVDHNTEVYVPYSFRTVVKVLLRPARTNKNEKGQRCQRAWKWIKRSSCFGFSVISYNGFKHFEASYWYCYNRRMTCCNCKDCNSRWKGHRLRRVTSWSTRGRKSKPFQV